MKAMDNINDERITSQDRQENFDYAEFIDARENMLSQIARL